MKNSYPAVTYCTVFKVWFTLRASTSAVAPESSTLFPSRLWCNVSKGMKHTMDLNQFIQFSHNSIQQCKIHIYIIQNVWLNEVQCSTITFAVYNWVPCPLTTFPSCLSCQHVSAPLPNYQGENLVILACRHVLGQQVRVWKKGNTN